MTGSAPENLRFCTYLTMILTVNSMSSRGCTYGARLSRSANPCKRRGCYRIVICVCRAGEFNRRGLAILGQLHGVGSITLTQQIRSCFRSRADLFCASHDLRTGLLFHLSSRAGR